MTKLIALYRTPKNPAAFDEYYFQRHVPLAKKVPGVRRYLVNSGPIGAPTEPGPIHLAAILEFDDQAALQAAFASPEGQAAVADIANFADGGAELLVFDTKDI